MSKVVKLECEVNDDEPYRLYSALESGKKRYELRVCLVDEQGKKNKWWDFHPENYRDDVVRMLKVTNAKDKSKSFERLVKSVVVGNSHKEVLERVGTQFCIPGLTNADEAVDKVYRHFYSQCLVGYPVIAIEL